MISTTSPNKAVDKSTANIAALDKSPATQGLAAICLFFTLCISWLIKLFWMVSLALQLLVLVVNNRANVSAFRDK